MITIVSGLPRSGTSLLMQMLKISNMNILSDNIRQADESNPRGYYEYEKVKSLQKDNSWMQQQDGKVIKIIAQLLKYIPKKLQYKVIFMERNLDEIMASQSKMIERMGKTVSGDNEVLKNVFSHHVDEIKTWLIETPNIDTLFLNYAEIINNPLNASKEIIDFLGLKIEPRKMASTVDSSLYRERN
jgi:hypothetical protein